MSPETRANEAALLSEGAAWRGVAAMLYRPPKHVIGLFTASGFLLRRRRVISHPTYLAMRRRARAFFADDGAGLTFDERVLAALFLALEAEDESRSALRSSGPGAP